jgi:hypothetical protein
MGLLNPTVTRRVVGVFVRFSLRRFIYYIYCIYGITSSRIRLQLVTLQGE